MRPKYNIIQNKCECECDCECGCDSIAQLKKSLEDSVVNSEIKLDSKNSILKTCSIESIRIYDLSILSQTKLFSNLDIISFLKLGITNKTRRFLKYGTKKSTFIL